MRAFLDYYESGLYDPILRRFELTSRDQVDAMYAYLDSMVANFLLQGSSYNNVAFGSLMQKAMNQSFHLLEEVLPLEITARVFAQSINSAHKAAGEGCHYFIDQVVTEPAAANQICLKYNFSDVEDLKFFINGTWYGGEYVGYLMGNCSMDADQVAAFYDTSPPANSSAPESFGYALSEAVGGISVQAGCLQQTNCSSVELATKQWGASYITLNPQIIDDAYTPISDTISGVAGVWGNWTTPGAPVPPEFYHYSEAANPPPAQSLNDTQVGKILSNCTTCWGLNDPYNAARFVTALEKPDTVLQGLFAREYQLWLASALYTPLRWMVQDFLFEGAWSTMHVDDYRVGFESDIAQKINAWMLFERGDVYTVSSNVTPVFNDQRGHVSTQTIGIKTGATGLDQLGKVLFVND